MKNLNELFLLIPIILSAFFLRVYALSDIPPSLYIDEVWSVYNPYLAEKGLLTLSLRGNAVHFLIGNYFTYSLLGESTFFARLPAAIFGTCLVLIVYLLSKEMFSKRVGLIGAILTAICPWGIQFSRYSIPSSNYVFFFTLSVYLLYKGTKIQDERKKIICYSLGSIVFGLTTYTHIISIAFVPLFIIGYTLIFTNKINREVIVKGLKYFFLGILSTSFTIYEYLNPIVLSGAGSRVSGLYSTIALSNNIWDLVVNILERMYYHLSPDFLVTTGGVAFASNTGFSETISHASLLRYGTGVTGALNYYGVIVYPALIYILYRAIKRSSVKEERILLWWIFVYAVASALPFYDNPNAARNIVGLPALIIVISLFLHRGFNFFCIHMRGKLSLNKFKIAKVFLFLAIIVSIVSPTVYYLNDYFTDYPSRSAKEFNYEYKMVADYLTAETLWNNTIYVRTDQSLWYSQQLLSFYSPNQPPSNIFAVEEMESNSSFQERSPGSIFITQYKSDLEKLEDFGILYAQKQNFQLPSGETALRLVELQFQDFSSTLVEGYVEDEQSIETYSNWEYG